MKRNFPEMSAEVLVSRLEVIHFLRIYSILEFNERT